MLCMMDDTIRVSVDINKTLERNLAIASTRIFVNESDLISLLKPIHDEKVPKYTPEILDTLMQKKKVILGILRATHWDNIEKILIRLKKNKDKHAELYDGMKFISYMMYRVDNITFKYIVELYVIQKILHNNTEAILKNLEYEELVYE